MPNNKERKCLPLPEHTHYFVPLRKGVFLLAAVLVFAGCERRPTSPVNTAYGIRSKSGHDSINGTSILAKLLENSGHKVNSWNALSPRTERYDVIVWAPDNYNPPSQKAVWFINDWLDNGNERLLIYIGRDYDAEIPYWEKQRAGAPSDQAIEIQRRLLRAKMKVSNRQEGSDVSFSGNFEEEWFYHDVDPMRGMGDVLSGPWSEGVDASKAEIDTRHLLPPLDDDRSRWSTQSSYSYGELEDWKSYGNNGWKIKPLLATDKEIIAYQAERDYWNMSRIIVVANGSFLLNMPLVNHEHRKIAEHLRDEIPRKSRILFLESGPHGIPVRSKQSTEEAAGWEAFTIWPLSILMIHGAILGILLCLAVFPIFGRPREIISGIVVVVNKRKQEGSLLDEDNADDASMAGSNFAKHINALGKMMARSRNTTYANHQIQQYQNSAKRDSGASHKENLT